MSSETSTCIDAAAILRARRDEREAQESAAAEVRRANLDQFNAVNAAHVDATIQALLSDVWELYGLLHDSDTPEFNRAQLIWVQDPAFPKYQYNPRLKEIACWEMTRASFDERPPTIIIYVNVDVPELFLSTTPINAGHSIVRQLDDQAVAQLTKLPYSVANELFLTLHANLNALHDEIEQGKRKAATMERLPTENAD